MPKAKKVAVVGFGNIGSGVVKALHEKLVPGMQLVKVIDIDIERKRAVKIPKKLLSPHWQTAVNDPEIDIIIELIGGIEPAKTIITRAMEKGKDVITANKMLLANEGKHIFSTAASLQRSIGFRAAFVGCHSLIHEFKQAGTSSRKFRRIYAILNGTSNYILSDMTNTGNSFEEALKAAQENGLAEADPSADIDGIDTANKINLMLMLIANSYQITPDFKIEGIRDINAKDIEYAGELGYSIKQVGVIEHIDGTFAVAVHPTLLPQSSLLGSLQGAYNGTELENEFGVISGLVAPGAGVDPTTDTVIKDLLDIAEGKEMPMPTTADPLSASSTDNSQRRYYLRFNALDQPGVLAQICNIFWKHSINIAGVIQKEPLGEKHAHIVMTTYEAKEKDIMDAIDEVDKLSFTKAATKLIRILSANT